MGRCTLEEAYRAAGWEFCWKNPKALEREKKQAGSRP